MNNNATIAAISTAQASAGISVIRISGDDAWLSRVLPRLEKAIDFQTRDPMYWDAEHGLVRRTLPGPGRIGGSRLELDGGPSPGLPAQRQAA